MIVGFSRQHRRLQWGSITVASKVSSRNTLAIVLCGGASRRVRDLVLDKPKAMLEVGGMPILWHIIKIYRGRETLESLVRLKVLL